MNAKRLAMAATTDTVTLAAPEVQVVDTMHVPLTMSAQLRYFVVIVSHVVASFWVLSLALAPQLASLMPHVTLVVDAEPVDMEYVTHMLRPAMHFVFLAALLTHASLVGSLVALPAGVEELEPLLMHFGVVILPA